MAESFSSWRIRGTSSSSRSSSLEYSFWNESSILFKVADEPWWLSWDLFSLLTELSPPAKAPVAGELPRPVPFAFGELPAWTGVLYDGKRSDSLDLIFDSFFEMPINSLLSAALFPLPELVGNGASSIKALLIGFISPLKNEYAFQTYFGVPVYILK